MHFLSCAGELNHHGRYMCDSMYEILGDDFKRITTQCVNKERLNLGYEKNAVTKYNTEQKNADKETVKRIISWSDVVDFGAAPEIYLEEAVKQNKIVFIRIERLFKEGTWKLFVPHIFFRYYRKYIRYRNNPNVYYLCVSAYAAKDLSKLGIKGERVLQWAYCPKFIPVDNTVFEKNDDMLNILWCGRMIDWKHPEVAVKIAEHLKKMKCKFHMKMIGNGEKINEIRRMIANAHLTSEVELIGSVEAKKVRNYMLESDVFLATSDQNEGWGVVINEAMNSGCVVFATNEMGAAPILIEENVNGFYLSFNNESEVARKITTLSKNVEQMKIIKRNAYETIKDYFSPDVYAHRFIDIAENVLEGKKLYYDKLGEKAKIR